MIRLRTLLAACIVVGCLSFAPVRAQEKALTSQVPSLRWIPADAGIYSAMLRSREQVDIVLKSKAYARFLAMPAVKMGLEELSEQWNDPNGPLAQVRDWYMTPGNADLVATVGELLSDEIFFYCDKNCAELGSLVQDVSNAGTFTNVVEGLKKGPRGLDNDPARSFKLMLHTLSDNADRLKTPDLVIGFRVGKSDPAKVAKIIADGRKLAEDIAPPGIIVKKEMIHGSTVHTLTIDGAMVPWNLIPWAQLEEQPGDLDKLRKRLSKLKLTLSAGVREKYLLVSVGEATAGLKALSGKGKLLVEQKEFAPLVKFGKERLTSISYASKEYVTTGTEIKPDEVVKDVGEMLRETTLTQAQKTKILKDVKNLTEDIKKWTPTLGAQLDFSFLNGRGYEGYHHDWTKYAGIDGSRPLTILEHVGGRPIAFSAGRSPAQLFGYEEFVKYVKLGHAYFEELALPELDKTEVGKYRKFMAQALPQLARIDKATSKMLLPSLDGQGAWVLDGKLKIDLPMIGKPMPVPELGIVAGLTDAALFRQAMSEYREAYNTLVDIAVKFAPPDPGMPDFKIPEPKSKKIGKKKGVTFYTWPLPMIPGLDPKIMPTAGVSQDFAVFGLSQAHAARMLAKNPFKMEGGPLGDITKPLVSAAHFDWAALIDTATPWIDLGLEEAAAENAVVDQVHTALDILKTLRSWTSATYLENGAVVTHRETIFSDVK